MGDAQARELLRGYLAVRLSGALLRRRPAAAADEMAIARAICEQFAADVKADWKWVLAEAARAGACVALRRAAKEVRPRAGKASPLVDAALQMAEAWIGGIGK